MNISSKPLPYYLYEQTISKIVCVQSFRQTGLKVLVSKLWRIVLMIQWIWTHQLEGKKILFHIFQKKLRSIIMIFIVRNRLVIWFVWSKNSRKTTKCWGNIIK